eukprot:363937-Chlamydomonas_euryale.AAC.4
MSILEFVPLIVTSGLSRSSQQWCHHESPALTALLFCCHSHAGLLCQAARALGVMKAASQGHPRPWYTSSCLPGARSRCRCGSVCRAASQSRLGCHCRGVPRYYTALWCSPHTYGTALAAAVAS